MGYKGVYIPRTCYPDEVLTGAMKNDPLRGTFVCLKLMLNVPVNSYGHVGRLPHFMGLLRSTTETNEYTYRVTRLYFVEKSFDFHAKVQYNHTKHINTLVYKIVAINCQKYCEIFISFLHEAICDFCKLTFVF